MISEVGSERDRLMRLIRRIAREEAWEVVDAMHEHLVDNEHKEEKPAEDLEA